MIGGCAEYFEVVGDTLDAETVAAVEGDSVFGSHERSEAAWAVDRLLDHVLCWRMEFKHSVKHLFKPAHNEQRQSSVSTAKNTFKPVLV